MSYFMSFLHKDVAQVSVQQSQDDLVVPYHKVEAIRSLLTTMKIPPGESPSFNLPAVLRAIYHLSHIPPTLPRHMEIEVVMRVLRAVETMRTTKSELFQSSLDTTEMILQGFLEGNPSLNHLIQLINLLECWVVEATCREEMILVTSCMERLLRHAKTLGIFLRYGEEEVTLEEIKRLPAWPGMPRSFFSFFGDLDTISEDNENEE